MILQSAEEGWRLYTYYKRKAVEVISYPNSFMLQVYRKGAVISISRFNYGEWNVGHYKIVKGKLKLVAFYADNSEMGGKNSGITYKINSRKVSRKKYNEFIKNITENSKEKKLRYYCVTASNIKKWTK